MRLGNFWIKQFVCIVISISLVLKMLFDGFVSLWFTHCAGGGVGAGVFFSLAGFILLFCCFYMAPVILWKLFRRSTRLIYFQPEPDPFNNRVRWVNPNPTRNLFRLNPNLLIFVLVSGPVRNCHPYYYCSTTA